ncbi:MAG: zinc-dependent metalloprotease, partial [Rudanella sp.]|nr:zinc-dependent metalloprotease [Rudanella sp.]
MRFLFAARLLASVAMWFVISAAMGQKTASRSPYQQFAMQMRLDKPVSITCSARLDNTNFYSVPAPESFLRLRGNSTARVAAPQTSTFVVTYNGFPNNARAAFQFAVDIWSSIIKSPIPINLRANWINLGSPSRSRVTLGSASPGDYYRLYGPTQKADAFYAIALAEKIGRKNLNGTSSDINANFNNQVDWYLGIDGKPGPTQLDFVTVVLHEIGHGLGFVSGRSVGNNNTASVLPPLIFDAFVENATGQKTINAALFPDNSAALYNQYVGDNLFFNGPVLQRKTGQKARLYAPSTFQAGSSTSHLDERTYPDGNRKELMTPEASNGVAVFNPGPLTLAMFEDMEWKTTSMIHDNRLRDSEDVIDRVLSVNITSDTTLVPNSVQLFIGRGTSVTNVASYSAVTPTRVGATDQYTYTLPASLATGVVGYYFQVKDASGRTFNNPGKLSVSGQQMIYRATLGPDNVAPTLSRLGLRTNGLFTSPAATTTAGTNNYYVLVGATDTLNISAIIADDRITGVDTAYVEWQINGTAQAPVPMRYTIQTRQLTGGVDEIDSVYMARLRFPTGSLTTGGRIQYRIVAIDSSRTKNRLIFPATGFQEIAVVAPQATVRTNYSNDFANPTTAAADFATNGFTIGQPSGFQSPLLQTEHPYRNGSTYDYENNTSALLLAPIRLKANPDSATIRFSEIAIVEPGELGSRYGDPNFFDYVIVEGSKDNGRTWSPMIEGYDVRENNDWNQFWTKTSTGTGIDVNSTGVPTPALFKNREIRMLETGLFKANDVVLVRFRLYADQLSYGWGWAIDNLQIQIPPPPPILATEPTKPLLFLIYPNPSSNGVIRVEAQLTKVATEAGLTLTSPMGQTIRAISLPVRGTTINEQVDLGQLPTGLYFLQLKAGDTSETKKIM